MSDIPEVSSKFVKERYENITTLFYIIFFYIFYIFTWK